jgi:hypothetical protein
MAFARRAGQGGITFRQINETTARIELGISHLRANAGKPLKAALRIWRDSAL